MASGDVAVAWTGAVVVTDDSDITTTGGTRVSQVVEFKAGTTSTTVNTLGVDLVHIEMSKSMSGGVAPSPETAFDSTKRYTITITEA